MILKDSLLIGGEMMNRRIVFFASVLALLLYVIFYDDKEMVPFLFPFIFGHCDTMDGPVIKDAKKALKFADVNIVLRWVKKKEDEEIIKEAFNKTIAVRALSPQAKEVADMSFFETLVRIHRAGEGVPYTGVKPAGTKVDPGIAAADRAVENGNVDSLVSDVTAHVAGGIKERFNALTEKKKIADQSVEAGREYVETYVNFIHYIEKLLQTVFGHNHKH